jgi:glycerol uptake facilitator-like aquaporin
MSRPLPALSAEFLGTALLLCVVTGSGVMAEKLCASNGGLALLANAAATVCGLFFLIRTLGPISGAHFNPVVSGLLAMRGQIPGRLAFGYVLMQMAGAVAGVWAAHAMFDLPLLQVSQKIRAGTGQSISECVATAGLVLVVLLSSTNHAASNVAAYIGAAYWFTASTSFANPAASFGRMWTDTFVGIAPASVTWFVVSQVVGAALGAFAHRLLMAEKEPAM